MNSNLGPFIYVLRFILRDSFRLEGHPDLPHSDRDKPTITPDLSLRAKKTVTIPTVEGKKLYKQVEPSGKGGYGTVL